jgi:DNA repair exonuclease SbcCD ATPase subunit
MKIIRLEAENFKKLKAVRIEPDGSTVIVGGGNGAGKTSALDAIRAAIGGKKACPPEPVRRGSKKSQIVLESEDFVVKRTFSKKGTAIEVKSKEGGVFPSPQAMLDKLVGSLSFDPLEFSRMKPKEQADVVRTLVGLDFTALEKKRAIAYTERTDINRELKKEKARLESLPEAKAPEKEVSVAELMKELRRREDINFSNDNLRSTLKKIRADYKDIVLQIGDLEEQRISLHQQGKSLKEKVDCLDDAGVDEIRQQIETAEETNALVRQAREHESAQAVVAALERRSDELTGQIEKADARKAEAIQSAKYPIDGLTVTDDGIELDGLPFEQASSAQKLRCCVAMGMALNPKLRVLLIHDGSLLDGSNLKTIAKMAEENDCQIWIERVGDGDECTVVIEDGEVLD